MPGEYTREAQKCVIANDPSASTLAAMNENEEEEEEEEEEDMICDCFCLSICVSLSHQDFSCTLTVSVLHTLPMLSEYITPSIK